MIKKSFWFGNWRTFLKAPSSYWKPGLKRQINWMLAQLRSLAKSILAPKVRALPDAFTKHRVQEDYRRKDQNWHLTITWRYLGFTFTEIPLEQRVLEKRLEYVCESALPYVSCVCSSQGPEQSRQAPSSWHWNFQHRLFPICAPLGSNWPHRCLRGIWEGRSISAPAQEFTVKGLGPIQ